MPDTFDLVERAERAINAATGTVDPAREYGVYHYVYLLHPRLDRHSGAEWADMPEYLEIIALMRAMGGSDLNLESLDGRVRLQPPLTMPVNRKEESEYGYRVPVDRDRYPRAGQACLRICYPTVAFWQNEVAITYDYGYGGPGELKEGHVTKIKIVSLDWLYVK